LSCFVCLPTLKLHFCSKLCVVDFVPLPLCHNSLGKC
jgi:hypothetical protein